MTRSTPGDPTGIYLTALGGLLATEIDGETARRHVGRASSLVVANRAASRSRALRLGLLAPVLAILVGTSGVAVAGNLPHRVQGMVADAARLLPVPVPIPYPAPTARDLPQPSSDLQPQPGTDGEPDSVPQTRSAGAEEPALAHLEMKKDTSGDESEPHDRERYRDHSKHDESAQEAGQIGSGLERDDAGDPERDHDRAGDRRGEDGDQRDDRDSDRERSRHATREQDRPEGDRDRNGGEDQHDGDQRDHRDEDHPTPAHGTRPWLIGKGGQQ